MNIEFIQFLRHKLQKRYRKANGSNSVNFHVRFIYFWKFINENMIFKSLLENLELEIPENLKQQIQSYKDKIIGKDEKEEIQIAFLVLKEISKNPIYEDGINYLFKFTYSGSRVEDRKNSFIEDYIQPIYEYLDEQLDSNVVVLGIIKRYKYKCEWFLREKLQSKIEEHANSRIEEQVLAPHLYEYLYDQGLDNLLYEGKSGDNGRFDFRVNTESLYQFIGEVKIYKGDKKDIYVGYKEILRHLESNGMQVGYLIIFNNSKNFLEVVPKITNQGKTIFIISIDIRKEKPNPSNKKEKRDEITESEILENLSEYKN